jgi:hypothetical protein
VPKFFLFLLVLLRGDPPGKVSQDSLQKRWILNQHQVKQVDAQEPLSEGLYIICIRVYYVPPFPAFKYSSGPSLVTYNRPFSHK